MLDSLLPGLDQFLTPEKVAAALRAVVLLLIGFVAARLIAAALRRVLSQHLETQALGLLGRGGYYLVLALFVVAALHQLGFDLGVVLGAAGVLTVALGFASQTSASNIISGLFLVTEAPFKVGDVVKVDGTTGEVLSVDLLSVKLRTYDNTFVRVPNETLIKTEVKTLTRFPIRRVDIPVGVAYKEDLERVRSLLLEVAEDHPLCLDHPQPLIFLQGFGESSVDLQYSVWTLRENYVDVKNTMLEAVKKALDAAGIEIPFPHRTLYTGSQTEPLPVRLLGDGSGAEPTGSEA